jgi:hypothetical protein
MRGNQHGNGGEMPAVSLPASGLKEAQSKQQDGVENVGVSDQEAAQPEYNFNPIHFGNVYACATVKFYKPALLENTCLLAI